MIAGTHAVFVEDFELEDDLGFVDLTEDFFQSFLLPIFVQVNFVVFPWAFVVLTEPILVQALPEVAANVLVFEIEKNKRTATEILKYLDIVKQ